MNRLPRVSDSEVVAALRRGGFELLRVRGSHHYLRMPLVSGLVVVPVHGNRIIPVGTPRSIVRQSSMSDDEFTALF